MLNHKQTQTINNDVMKDLLIADQEQKRFPRLQTFVAFLANFANKISIIDNDYTDHQYGRPRKWLQTKTKGY